MPPARSNPAREPAPGTVAYVVGPREALLRIDEEGTKGYQDYLVILVDAGRVVGGAAVTVSRTDHPRIGAVQALRGWGPLLYRAVFTWAHRQGYAHVYSDSSVSGAAWRVWHRFVADGVARPCDDEGVGAYFIAGTGKYTDVPFVSVPVSDYEEYGPKGDFGASYEPGAVFLDSARVVEWPARLTGALRRSPARRSPARRRNPSDEWWRRPGRVSLEEAERGYRYFRLVPPEDSDLHEVESTGVGADRYVEYPRVPRNTMEGEDTTTSSTPRRNRSMLRNPKKTEVDVRERSPDAEFILEDEEFDYVWTEETRPLTWFKRQKYSQDPVRALDYVPEFDPEDPDGERRRMAFVRDASNDLGGMAEVLNRYPMLAWEDGLLLDGQHRLKVAQEEGLTEARVLVGHRPTRLDRQMMPENDEDVYFSTRSEDESKKPRRNPSRSRR